jgi:hypothetical protein
MDQEAHAASGFEHGTVAGVLWQKGALRFAAGSEANAGPDTGWGSALFPSPQYRTVKDTRCSEKAAIRLHHS